MYYGMQKGEFLEKLAAIVAPPNQTSTAENAAMVAGGGALTAAGASGAFRKEIGKGLVKGIRATAKNDIGRKEMKDMMSNTTKHHNLKIPKLEYVDDALKSSYGWVQDANGKVAPAYVRAGPNQAILMHELGHAIDYNRRGAKAMGTGTMARLGREARASGWAVRELYRQKGAGAALKGGAQLVMPFGTYLHGAVSKAVGPKAGLAALAAGVPLMGYGAYQHFNK